MARIFRQNHAEQEGLTWEEAEKRLVRYGPNTLQQKPPIHPLKIFAGQFRDFMVLILLGAAGKRKRV